MATPVVVMVYNSVRSDGSRSAGTFKLGAVQVLSWWCCCQRRPVTDSHRRGASCQLGHVGIVVMLHHDEHWYHWHRPCPRHSKFESSHWQWAESEPTSLNHRLQPRLDSMCIQLLWPSGYLLSTKLQRLQVCCWTILRTRSYLAPGRRPALENTATTSQCSPVLHLQRPLPPGLPCGVALVLQVSCPPHV